MKMLLADAAPEPAALNAIVIVVAFVCIAFVAALTILVVWLVRRTKNRKY